MPTACLASATVVTVPETGATTSPEDGTTPNPSPRILAANVSSGTFSMDSQTPSHGARTDIAAGAGADSSLLWNKPENNPIMTP